ncbi:MAG TPA: PPOX class F420-dependent oxidoreductase [Streptosporangiaceae bacterium]
MDDAAVAGRWRQRESAAPEFRGRYLSITSFRQDGTPVATPVWFAERDGLLLAVTDAASGKVKRIRRNPHVRIAICTASGRLRGPEVSATAEILTGPQVARAEQLLKGKYRLDLLVIGPVRSVQQALHIGRPRTGTVLLVVTPG